MARVALIGSNGQLGSDIARLWSSSELGMRGDELVGLTHADIDVTDPQLVGSVLNGVQPSLVINTAAFHRVDDCEQEAAEAFRVNALGTKYVAEACREIGIPMAHFSTDYVFEGKTKAPYDEGDAAMPISAYGISKLAGEQFLRYVLPHDHIIVRSSGLYGAAGASGKGGNFIETVLRLEREKRPIRIVSDQVSTPTYTMDLAAAFIDLLAKDGRGTFHITNSGVCSWFQVAQELFSLLELTPDLKPTTSEAHNARALRPAYSVLANRRLIELGIEQPRDWKEALADYLRLKGRLGDWGRASAALMPRHLIAIDASGLTPQPSGPDRYTLSLIRALSRVDSEHDYVVYACDFSLPDLAGLGDNFRLIEAGPWAPGGRRVWQQAGLALDLARRRASLLHSPNQTTPRFVPCKRVVTIYDMGPFILPEEHDAASRQAIQASVKRADAVLVPSESVATRLIEDVNANPDRVHVTYPGVDPSFRAMDPETCAALAMDSYGLRPGYILSLGPGHPQKNRGAIFMTLRRLLDDGLNVHVAVLGDDGSPAQQAMVTDFGLQDHVSFCGFVPQQDLPALYNAAAVLLHPAMHDGLGLSVLEAMACSAPLVITDRSSPPELAGDAGIKIDPFDIDAIVNAVTHVLDDSSLATRMRFDGLKRAADFSWEVCAERTVDVYRQILNESPEPELS